MKKFLALLISVCAVILFSHNAIYAQKKKGKMYPSYKTKKAKPSDKFLNTQWWLGFRAGANLTDMNVIHQYSSFSPLNYNAEITKKSYKSFETAQMGGQAGLEITLYHKGFSFSLQPNYARHKFTYSNAYAWQDATDPVNTLTLEHDIEQQLDYIEFPLFIKYDLTRGNLRPFLQIGGYYGTLVGAYKSIETNGIDNASGFVGPFATKNDTYGNKDQYLKSSAGIAGGAGFSFDYWNLRIVFDVTYRYGMHNIANVKNRYNQNELVGLGDVPDDTEMRNISMNFGLLFPLRFISKKYDAFN